MLRVPTEESTEAKPLLKWVETAESLQEVALLAGQERDRQYQAKLLEKAEKNLKTTCDNGYCAGLILMGLVPLSMTAPIFSLFIAFPVILFAGLMIFKREKLDNQISKMKHDVSQER